MKQLNFSTKSWHSVLWKSTWGEYLPNNICAYFWSLLSAILLAPIAIIGHVFNIFKCRIVAAWWALYPVGCVGIGCLPLLDDKGGFNQWHHWAFWKIFGYGILISLCFAAVIAIIIFCAFLWDRREENKAATPKENKQKSEPKPSPITEGFKALRGRYCSKINWE